MDEATCPHCKTDFTPDDLHQSGQYLCPGCGKELFIEVDYNVTYEASCIDSEHDWQRPGDPWPDGELCTLCGKFRMNTDRKDNP